MPCANQLRKNQCSALTRKKKKENKQKKNKKKKKRKKKKKLERGCSPETAPKIHFFEQNVLRNRHEIEAKKILSTREKKKRKKEKGKKRRKKEKTEKKKKKKETERKKKSKEETLDLDRCEDKTPRHSIQG